MTMKLKQNKTYYFARFLEITLGSYFFLGALFKVTDIDKFAVQMAAYKVIESPLWLQYAVLFTVFLEIGLGVAMILGLRMRGLVLAAVQGVTVVFSALILYAWIYHDLEDCGCFPVIKMSPPVSLFKNGLILLTSSFILWRLVIKGVSTSACVSVELSKSPGGRGHKKGFVLSIIRVALSFLIALAFAAVAWHDMDRVALNHADSGIESFFSNLEIFSEYGYFNLGSGVYLVPIMSATCPECKEKVPELNDLFLDPDVPPMIALCYEDKEGDLDTFRGLTNPFFPTYSLGNRSLLYFQLIEKDPFRLLLIRDGRIAASWDGYVPPWDDLHETLMALGIGDTF